jgi:multidrug transporter EmrE-like cation transporter
MTSLFSILLTILAYTLLSIGFVLMKKGISWIGYKGKKDKLYYQNLFIWILGFIIMNSNIVPNTIALKFLEPHIVSAFAGWGIIMLVFFSHVILKERLFKPDFIYTAVIFISIIFLNLLEQKKDQIVVKLPWLIFLSLIPLCLMAPAFLKHISKRLKTILFAAISGISTGMIIVTIKVLVIDSGFNVRSYFSSPYLYIYLFFSVAAFITLQISYKLGHMMLVGPVQYSAAIIYPVLCSYAVFANNIEFMQLVSIALVIYGTINILKNH